MVVVDGKTGRYENGGIEVCISAFGDWLKQENWLDEKRCKEYWLSRLRT
jgi:hypothetical protein